MGTDLERIFVGKGVTTWGPFPSLDEMTYADKKGCQRTLAATVFLQVEFKWASMKTSTGQESKLEGIYFSLKNKTVEIRKLKRYWSRQLVRNRNHC
jgi:hypothetical protein